MSAERPHARAVPAPGREDDARRAREALAVLERLAPRDRERLYAEVVRALIRAEVLTQEEGK
jgi:hypothetical protein